MAIGILVTFECVQEEVYTFSVKNPRDIDEFNNAYQVFADKIVNNAYKTFSGDEIKLIFTDSHNLGKVRIIGGSYSECVDVKFLIIKIDTKNYIDYTVDYKLYAGYPWEAFENEFKR